MDTQDNNTEVVKSGATINLPLEDYNDLKSRANEPKVTNATYVNKTDEQHAEDMKVYGGATAAIGAAAFVVGLIVNLVGSKKGKSANGDE